MGVAAFLGQMTTDVSALPSAERAFYEAIPVWAIVAFGVAVSTGVLASVALLLRQRWAAPLFIVSLLAIIIQVGHSIFIGDGIEVFGPEGFVLPFLTLSIAAALIGYARYSAAKCWIT